MIDFKYSIFGKQYGFKPITTQDALKLRNTLPILTSKSPNFDELDKVNSVIDNIAIKYLVIKDESGIEFDNLNFKTLQALFEDNEGSSCVMVEVQKQFLEMFAGFLQVLPSYQDLQIKK
ncbi:TPA: hypothetical protein R5B02_001630 [Campylobacter jejuni]|nr:hypothetical protein [Campylobacter jejuni]